MVLLPVLTIPSLRVPSVPPVDSGGEHGHEHDDGQEESDDTRDGEARALDAICPGGLAVLVAP